MTISWAYLYLALVNCSHLWSRWIVSCTKMMRGSFSQAKRDGQNDEEREKARNGARRENVKRNRIFQPPTKVSRQVGWLPPDHPISGKTINNSWYVSCFRFVRPLGASDRVREFTHIFTFVFGTTNWLNVRPKVRSNGNAKKTVDPWDTSYYGQATKSSFLIVSVATRVHESKQELKEIPPLVKYIFPRS